VKPAYSVVIATYNRGDALERLLLQLGEQTIPANEYEVIVVDDGSADPVEPRLRTLATPYALRVLTQANGGPAVARHAGIDAAVGEIIIIVDDDMQIAGDFLASHLTMHRTGTRNVVLGRVTTDPSVRLPLFERYAMAKLDRLAERVGNGTTTLRGSDLYTANVSFRRADYVLVGGFDRSLRLSEDSELGIRLELAGATFLMSQAAAAVHASDHVSLKRWMQRAQAYGVSESRISEKHPTLRGANPWRFLFMVNRVSRMFMVASVAMPRLMGMVAHLAMRLAFTLAALGAERAAIAGTTFVYGLQYFRGIRQHARSRRLAFDGLRRFLTQCRDDEVGWVAGITKLVADLRADQAAMLHADAKYRSKVSHRPRLVSDVVQRIGLQMMFAYRMMRYLRARRRTILTRITARMIRHLYSADIHWDAELAPGVMIVHGVGLVIGHSARVGPRCVLFHHVTLGENIHPETREIGTPTLEADVHVGPGATLLGPITVGEGTKITAGALLMQSVPPQSLVESPAPSVRPRSGTGRLARALPLIALLAVSAQSCAEVKEIAPARTESRGVVNHEIVERIYDGGLQGAWTASGSAPAEMSAGSPVTIDLANGRSWMVAKPGLSGSFGALVFHVAGDASLIDALEVRVDSPQWTSFARITVTPGHRRDLGADFSEVVIPFQELNASAVPFDRIVWRLTRRVKEARLRLDKIALTAGAAVAAATPSSTLSGETATVECALPAHPINPMIYGIAFDPMHDARDGYVWNLGATARRWGGNPSSRYNWQLGNAWNTANDWFFRNVNYTGKPGFTYDEFLDANLAHRVSTALTLPIIGFVAKDTSTYAYPRATFGRQRAYDPERTDAGNGVSMLGRKLVADPLRTSVAAPPEMIGRWVSTIRQKDQARGRSVQMYILDNEPSLWNSTHRDVHPQPTSYDELLSRTIEYGTAVRRADPEAVIAGPAEWGWPGYLFSAVDAEAGFRNKPDRRSHGDVPLIPWYLKQLRAHEQKTGVRVIDVVDVHFYPQGQGVFGRDGGTDEATAELRVRSTRALWDSTYVDESWIQDTVRLIPRVKEWIAENYPGLGISIGEWNFGAETHMSGGLAVAEALGQFGRAGIRSAFYWTYPPEGSPAYHAFRAFRNYDGAGRAFGDHSVMARSGSTISLFASRDDARNAIVLVALNLSPERPATARFDHASCGVASARRQFVYREGSNGLTLAPGISGDGVEFDATLPPYSITVFEISLASRDNDATSAR
jgi:serine acetyltransferase/GT2 family glycosyltransferase